MFPNHSQTLHTITLLLLSSCWLCAVIWHVRIDTLVWTINGRSKCRFQIGKCVVIYLIPVLLILGSCWSAITIANDYSVPWILMVLTFLYEMCLTKYLLSSSSAEQKSDVFFGLGRRLLIFSLGILCGAAAISIQHDFIDYYGPVYVTNLKLLAERPQSQNINKYNPTYYYYYTLEETLEWGGSWACPADRSSNWCKHSHRLDEDNHYGSSFDCKKTIECQGKPPNDDDIVGECADTVQQVEAYTYLLKCVSNTLQGSGGLPFDSDIYDSTTHLNHTRAPYQSSISNANVAWRTVAVSCGDCNSIARFPPQDLARISHVAWTMGCLGLVTATILFFYGTRVRKQFFLVVSSLESDLQLNTIT